MALIPGVNVTGAIVPSDSADTYGVTDPQYGIGGMRTCATTTARNAITSARLQEGMLVYTQDVDHHWLLKPAPWTGTDSDWTSINLTAAGGGSDKNFVFNQATPSATWNIVHNLGKYPAVFVVDSAGNVVIGDIKYIDLNTTTVTFASGFSGSAYLN